MPTDNNELNFKPFGSNADNKYKPIEFGNPAVVVNPADADAVNQIRGNAEWERGVEGNNVVTAEGSFGFTSGNIENAKYLAFDLLLSRYIYPRGIFAYSSTIPYNINSHCFDISTGIIYKSIADLHIGQALNNVSYWEDTGQTIASYITQITQNASDIGALQVTSAPIILTYSTATVVLYSAGTFNPDDGSVRQTISSGSVNLATVGLNGIDTGSVPTSGWLYTYAIFNPTTGIRGLIASLSSTTPTLPSGFTKKKRIKNGLLRIASSAIQPFSHWENEWISTNQIIIANQTNVINYTNSALPSIPLKADLTTYFSTNTTGQSTMVTWGDLKPWTAGTDALFDSANNGHDSSVSGYIRVSDGVVRATHPTTTGGIDNAQIILQAISEL
jgi:hypothetical protein